MKGQFIWIKVFQILFNPKNVCAVLPIDKFHNCPVFLPKSMTRLYLTFVDVYDVNLSKNIAHFIFQILVSDRRRYTNNFNSVISRTMDIHSFNYDNFIFFGDFNANVSDKAMLDFCESYNLKSLIKQPTCFKNFENPSCIDLFLTNGLRSFCSSYVIGTGLCDFHKITVSVMKMHYRKLPPKIINYRDYKKFSNGNFLNSVKEVFSNKNPNEKNLG